MRYWFLGLITTLLINSAPASAQNFAAEIAPAQKSLDWRLPLVSLASRPDAPSPLNNLKSTSGLADRSPELAPASYRSESSLASHFSIEESRTPFSSESTMPVARLWKGHLQIEGFQQTVSKCPVFAGPPLPPAASDQASLTRIQDFGGMSLRLNFGKSPENQPLQIRRTLRSILGR
jgi:hypothetical protein